MTSAVNIRRAGPDDAKQIFSLIRGLSEHEDNVPQFALTLRKLKRVLSGRDGRVCCLIAQCGKRPVGLALWFYAFSSLRGAWLIFLEDLFVVPDFRRRGIGKRLLRELARRALRERCPAVVWVARTSNRNALLFYKALAAVPHRDSCHFVLNGEALSRLAKRRA